MLSPSRFQIVQLIQVVFVFDSPVFLSRQFLLWATGKLIATEPLSRLRMMAFFPILPIKRVSNTLDICFWLFLNLRKKCGLIIGVHRPIHCHEKQKELNLE